MIGRVFPSRCTLQDPGSAKPGRCDAVFKKAGSRASTSRGSGIRMMPPFGVRHGPLSPVRVAGARAYVPLVVTSNYSLAMPTVEMRELALSVRGRRSTGAGSGGMPPPHIMGMVSGVRSAIREAHVTSPAAGKSKIAGSLGGWLAWAGDPNPGRRATATAAANYIDAVERCADWHAASPLVFRTWEEKGIVRYSPADVVDVVVRIVLEDLNGRIWGRLVFWDGPPLSVDAAELLASPAVEVLDARYRARGVAGVEVWQCRTNEAHTVTSAQARARRPQVAVHVANM